MHTPTKYSVNVSKTVLMFALLFGCLWVFIHLAMEVMAGDTQALDRTIMLWFRESADLAEPIGPGWLEEIMRDSTALGSNWLLVIITGVTAAVLWLSEHRDLAKLLIGAILTGMALSFLLKLGFDRPRPDLVPHHTQVYTSSFPSGHAMMSSLTYFTLAAVVSGVQRRRSIRILIFASAAFIAFLVGFSRVFLGVHWPSDVLAGWFAGAFWASLCFYFSRYLAYRQR